jgi:hypothetical protein
MPSRERRNANLLGLSRHKSSADTGHVNRNTTNLDNFISKEDLTGAGLKR